MSWSGDVYATAKIDSGELRRAIKELIKQSMNAPAGSTQLSGGGLTRMPLEPIMNLRDATSSHHRKTPIGRCCTLSPRSSTR